MRLLMSKILQVTHFYLASAWLSLNNASVEQPNPQWFPASPGPIDLRYEVATNARSAESAAIARSLNVRNAPKKG